MDASLPLFSDGLQLAMVGMGTVFSFLTTLVFATMLMSKLVTTFSPTPPPVSASATSDSAQQARLIAIVTAAIHAHRAKNVNHD